VLRLVTSSGLTFSQRTVLEGFALPYVLKDDRPNTFRAVMEAGEARLINADDAYVQGLSERSKAVMIGSGSGGFIAAPLMQGDRPLGILLVDQGDTNAKLSSTDVQLCARLANVLALAISNARLFDKVRRRERALADSLLANQKFAQYLPRNVAEGILEDPAQALELGGEPRDAAVLFADLAGFTSWASTVEAQTVVHLLNRWFSATDEVIADHAGIVDKRIGDGLMVVFLHEDGEDHPAVRAYATALELLGRAAALMMFAAAEGYEHFGVRLGVNYGEAVAGNIGSPTRVEYTLIGDVVNLAQRLESVAPVGSVRVSGSVARELADGQLCSKGFKKLKGKSEPIEIFGPA
jgi:adenylate cyclase